MNRKKKSNNNRLLYQLLGITAALIIFGIIGKSKGWIGKEPSVEVEFSKVEHRNITEVVTASGAIQPVTEVKITPEVSGEIIEMLIKEGDSVRTGQLLLRLKPDNAMSALERAKASMNQNLANLAQARAAMMKSEANLTRAELEFKRQQNLFREKVIPEADFEASQAAFLIASNDLEAAKQNVIAAQYIVQSAEATVKEARENLEFTTIKAPMGGIVSKLNVEKGEVVLGTRQMAGTEMLRIADLSNMEVRVDVNENDIIRVSLGDTTIIDVDSYAFLEKKFKGIVTQIANSAKNKTSADAVTEFEVRIRILNESYRELLERNNSPSPFRPGMTASVEIITNKKEQVLSVPLSAVTLRGMKKDSVHTVGFSEITGSSTTGETETEVVFINDNGRAKMAAVKTGISDFGNIEVISGLSPGQEVVTGPFNAVSKTLKDGDLLKNQEAGKSGRR
jgi:HlyD family secretion protein